MRKVLLTIFVTMLLPSFAFGQDEASSEKPKEEKHPREIIVDPELDPFGPLFNPGTKTEKIGYEDDDKAPEPNVLEP